MFSFILECFLAQSGERGVKIKRRKMGRMRVSISQSKFRRIHYEGRWQVGWDVAKGYEVGSDFVWNDVTVVSDIL